MSLCTNPKLCLDCGTNVSLGLQNDLQHPDIYGYDMHRSDFGAPFLAATLLASGLPAIAQDACGDFTAYYRINDVYTDDRGEPGPSPADVRHGAAELLDETDASNGELYWKSTLMPRHVSGLGDAPHPFIVVGHVSMP